MSTAVRLNSSLVHNLSCTLHFQTNIVAILYIPVMNHNWNHPLTPELLFFALSLRISNDFAMGKLISLFPLIFRGVPAPLPWLPACYLCEWGVISTPTLWMRVYFSWQQLKCTPLGQIIWLDHCQVCLTSSSACPSLNMSHLLISWVWMSTVCFSLDTYSMTLLFIAPYLSPPLAQKPSRNNTSKLNRVLYFLCNFLYKTI